LKILVVSDRAYKKTSRGIDIITTCLAENGHFVDHLVFFRRNKFPEIQVTQNIRQLFFYDSIKLYRGKLQFLFPGFILLGYFRHIIRKQPSLVFSEYDYVVLESGHPIYLASEINSKIIYRQSDPTYISFNSNRSFYKKLEAEVIKKSLFVTSALDSKFFLPECKSKIFYWHSGFIPNAQKHKSNTEMSFCIIGGGLDWNLIRKIAKSNRRYLFKVIGVPGKKFLKQNINYQGYLDLDEYQETILSASVIIIPYTRHFSNQLRQTSFTAKILFSMQLGKPILLRAYGTIQNTDQGKKIFVYKTHNEALLLFDRIIARIECGDLNYDISQETKDFLAPQTIENRQKELEDIFSHFL